MQCSFRPFGLGVAVSHRSCRWNVCGFLNPGKLLLAGVISLTAGSLVGCKVGGFTKPSNLC